MSEYINLKCKPEYALDLRKKHPEISGAWHMNKKHWNQVNLFGTLPNEFVKHLIRHSYNEVIKKLPRKIKDEKGIKLLDNPSNTYAL